MLLGAGVLAFATPPPSPRAEMASALAMVASAIVRAVSVGMFSFTVGAVNGQAELQPAVVELGAVEHDLDAADAARRADPVPGRPVRAKRAVLPVVDLQSASGGGMLG
jgi:hypothetical protein